MKVGSWCLCGKQCCEFKRDHSLQISVWNRFDLLAFRFFNNRLLTGEQSNIIAKVFAILNIKVFGEIISNIFMLIITCLVLYSKNILKNQTRKMKTSVLLAIIIYGMAFQLLLSKLYRDFMCPKRPSPSVVFKFSTVGLTKKAIASSSLSDVFSMERLFLEVGKLDLIKEVAYDSWPGEHGVVNFIWAILMSVIISRSLSSPYKKFLLNIPIWTLTVVLSSARLISGAHWMSDVIAGGLSEAIIITSLGVYTPMLRWCTLGIHKLITRNDSVGKKLP
ncbi:unnamed protein product [Didymodactylos carnosus]|uniref:Phosphatidic acid phosphatase type 2/haloperoxidase domain-containing protein n=1 Tax=Didymodactylos carnosus TaxID=1234261 RepID=A0A813WU68_9BILA|nr:unnamed protein product [Didymodactylos carnosus]CAF3647501.1 unnamed protein product [Didymodactylos carnosus]